MERRSILIVAPHPDDETLGCGGTFALRAAAGFEVAVVVVTDGCNLFRLSPWKIEVDPTPAEISARRKAETRRAVDILGGDSESIRFLDVEDGALSEHVDAVAATLADVIRRVGPEEIYVTSEYEEHADHVAAAGAVRAAMRQAGSGAALRRYIIALRPGLTPDAVPDPTITVDIAEQFETKRKALTQFDSHLKIVAKGQSEPFFNSLDPYLQPGEIFLVDP